MGRRSINTTKSGKFMNPTDQARKEARKKELKKNKRQRMTVRHAVLKSKDPVKILEEIELIDQIEFDPLNPPTLNEKVLKEKRKKLKETFQRVLTLYEKEDPEYMVELKKNDAELDRKRDKLQMYYEQVKTTERVQIDQIPLPEAFVQPAETGMIPLPEDIPLPSLMKIPGRSILKHSQHEDFDDAYMEPAPIVQERKPAGPPPGSPLPLSDSEDEEYDPEKGIEENLGKVSADASNPIEKEKESDKHDGRGKSRKIRFADDSTQNDSVPEKDTRLSFRPAKAPISSLQMRMLKMAGQKVPAPEADAEEETPPPPGTADKENKEEESSSDEDSDSDKSESDDDADDEKKNKGKYDSSDDDDDDEDGVPLPPGPPPGMPPKMLLPPSLAGPPALSGMSEIPPQPRPVGLPPGPPPGLPPGLLPRLPPRIPSGQPPHILRAPSHNTVAPPSIPLPPGLAPLPNASVLSAPPSIIKLAQPVHGDDHVPRVRSGATIEAKPQIKNFIGDSTRFMPTALKVKRQIRDSKGRIKQIGKEEKVDPKHVNKAAPQTKTKDHAYEAFMKEMSGLM